MSTKAFFKISLILSCWLSGLNLSAKNASLNRDSVFRISAGGGIAFSTINMRIEPLGELKKGWNMRAGLRFRRRLGVMAEYTYQLRHDAVPAWERIDARNFDFNLNYLFFNVSNTDTKFYAISGICFQQWTGLYKGPAAVNQDNIDYVPGDTKRFNWLSLNTGLGFERYYGYFGLFGEFKFRVGKNNPSDPVGIEDVGFMLGARMNVLSFGLNTKSTEPVKHIRSKRRGIKPKMYHWF
jgi:hypothetical protein